MTKSKEKRMTIAAGFICSEGVLLCADTEQTGWAMKLHDSKVDHFEHPGGKIAYAYAGNVPFACSAIQKLRRHLQRRTFNDTMAEVEKVLDREYRRNVLSHPDHLTDSTISYRILFGVWSPGERVRLYSTSLTAIEEVKGYQCIGMGDYLAHYLVRQHVAGGIPQRHTLIHASYALSAIKDYVPDCGGMSIYVLLQNDGRTGVLTSIHPGPCSEIQEYAKPYDVATRELLIAMVNDDGDDVHFEQYLREVFAPRLLEVRKKWTKARRERWADFRASNPHLNEGKARSIFRDMSIGLLPL
jgi:20S proteasome alpha/beta subunit